MCEALLTFQVRMIDNSYYFCSLIVTEQFSAKTTMAAQSVNHTTRRPHMSNYVALPNRRYTPPAAYTSTHRRTSSPNISTPSLTNIASSPMPSGHEVDIKVCLVGDPQTGKRSIATRYSGLDDNKNSASFNASLSYHHKTLLLKNMTICFDIWYMSANGRNYYNHNKQRNNVNNNNNALYQHNLKYSMEEAKAIIFTFDLTEINTLYSIKSWYKTARQYNKVWLIFI